MRSDLRKNSQDVHLSLKEVLDVLRRFFQHSLVMGHNGVGRQYNLTGCVGDKRPQTCDRIHSPQIREGFRRSDTMVDVPSQ